MKLSKLLRILTLCITWSALPLEAALIAFFDFDTDFNDRSGNDYNPTASAGITSIIGYEGSAFAFSGSGSYIHVPLDINPSVYPQLTMGAWAKATSGTPIRQVISHDNGGYDRSVGIDFRGGGTGWTAFAGTGSVLGFQPLTLDEWTFLAVVYDQTIGSVTLYVNGVAFSGSATLGSGNTFTRIGMNPAFGEYFQGSIDNVFFFGDALSPAAINQIRTGGAAAIVPEPSVITSLGLGIFLFATYLRRSKQTRR